MITDLLDRYLGRESPNAPVSSFAIKIYGSTTTRIEDREVNFPNENATFYDIRTHDQDDFDVRPDGDSGLNFYDIVLKENHIDPIPKGKYW